MGGHNIFKRRLSSTGTAISAGTKEDVNAHKVDPELVKVSRKKVGGGNATGDGNATGTATETDGDKHLLEKKCGSCYGSEQTPEQCCDTCEEVRESYRLKGWAFSDPESITQCQNEGFSENLKAQKENKEGCSVYGYLDVNKVAGNFHFAPGKRLGTFPITTFRLPDCPYQTDTFLLIVSVIHLRRRRFRGDFPRRPVAHLAGSNEPFPDQRPDNPSLFTNNHRHRRRDDQRGRWKRRGGDFPRRVFKRRRRRFNAGADIFLPRIRRVKFGIGRCCFWCCLGS